jgi:hypothetical protein
MPRNSSDIRNLATRSRWSPRRSRVPVTVGGPGRQLMCLPVPPGGLPQYVCHSQRSAHSLCLLFESVLYRGSKCLDESVDLPPHPFLMAFQGFRHPSGPKHGIEEIALVKSGSFVAAERESSRLPSFHCILTGCGLATANASITSLGPATSQRRSIAMGDLAAPGTTWGTL